MGSAGDVQALDPHVWDPLSLALEDECLARPEPIYRLRSAPRGTTRHVR